MLDLQISFSVKYYYLILVIIKVVSYLQRLWDLRPIRLDCRGRRTSDERLLGEGDEADSGVRGV